MGPRAYRARVRAIGPLVALLVPALLGLLSLVLLRDNTSTGRGVAGFGAAVFAAPALLVLGAPLRSGAATYLGAIAVSAVLWLGVGVLAARRATRRPAASWREYWTECMWLTCSVWAGVVVSLVASNLVLGNALL